MKVRNVILDWSGTLVDDLLPVVQTTNHVFKTYGLAPLSVADFRAQFCLPIRKFYESRIPHVPQEELERTFLSKYPEFQDGITVLPHTREFLEFCRQQRMGVYIASTVDARTYAHQMQRFNLLHFVTKPYIGLEDKTAKIHHILEENALHRDETLFVGDMEHDIEAGKAGGVHTCAVLTGYNDAAMLRAMKPDLICEHLGELQEHLRGAGAVHG